MISLAWMNHYFLIIYISVIEYMEKDTVQLLSPYLFVRGVFFLCAPIMSACCKEGVIDCDFLASASRLSIILLEPASYKTL